MNPVSHKPEKANFTAEQSGNWSDAATWGGEVLPTSAADDSRIVGGKIEP